MSRLLASKYNPSQGLGLRLLFPAASCPRPGGAGSRPAGHTPPLPPSPKSGKFGGVPPRSVGCSLTGCRDGVRLWGNLGATWVKGSFCGYQSRLLLPPPCNRAREGGAGTSGTRHRRQGPRLTGPAPPAALPPSTLSGSRPARTLLHPTSPHGRAASSRTSAPPARRPASPGAPGSRLPLRFPRESADTLPGASGESPGGRPAGRDRLNQSGGAARAGGGVQPRLRPQRGAASSSPASLSRFSPPPPPPAPCC